MDEVIAEAAFYGRAKYQSTGAQVTLNFTVARVQTVVTTAGGLSIKLQSARQLKTGGPVGFVVNAGSNSFSLIDNSNGALTTLAAGECVELALVDNATAAGVWIVHKGTANFVPDPPVNLYFYVVGGSPTSVDQVTREYNSQVNVWTQRSDMPSPVLNYRDQASETYGTAGYFVGPDDGSASAANHKRIYQYDPDVWTAKTSGTVRWGDGAGAALGTSIVWFNGNTYDTWDTSEYSVGGDSWTARASRANGRRASSVQARQANSKIVLPYGASNATDTYVVDTFTAKTSRPGASGLLSTCTVKANVVWTYGGNPSAILASVYTYDESTDTWASKANMSQGRVEAACCSIGSYNYISGGKMAAAGTSVTGTTANVTNATWEHTTAADTYLTVAVITPSSGSPTGVYAIMNHGAAITP